MADLHLDYRPTEFDEVIGQDVAVESLERALAKGSGQSFLFTGPSGVGKTTMARILADHVGCGPTGLTEVDAATYTGVDAMRELSAQTRYSSFGEDTAKVFIVDEAHGLSKQAWNSLLKVVEEPPPDVYWVFCTTEGHRVPETIKTRCLIFNLGLVDSELIYDLLLHVNEDSQLGYSKDVLSLLSDRAEGSPRQALTFAAACQGASTRKQAALLLKTVEPDDAAALEFCRFLMYAHDLGWSKASIALEGVKDLDPEQVRRAVIGYYTPIMLGQESEFKILKGLEVLDIFGEPFNSSDGLAPLIVALGRLIYASENEYENDGE